MDSRVISLYTVVVLVGMAIWSGGSLAQEKTTAESQPAAENIRIAVADFSVTGDVGVAEAGKAVAELLTSEFDKDRFQVVERAQLAKLLNEQDLTLAMVAADSDVLSKKGLKGVRYLVLGSVVKFGNLSISARLVEVNTGDVIQTAKVSAKDAQGLQDALGSLARQLQMTDKEKKANLQAVELRTSVDGAVFWKDKEIPVGPARSATFMDLAGGEELTLEFHPKDDKDSVEKIIIPLGNKPKGKYWCVFYTSGGKAIVTTGSGVPAERLVEKYRPTDGKWANEYKEPAFAAAVLDAMNKAAEKAVRLWDDNGKGNPISKLHIRNDSATKAVLSEYRMFVQGVEITSYTRVVDFATESFMLNTLWPIGAKGRKIEIVARDFAIGDYKLVGDMRLGELIRTYLKEKDVAVKTDFHNNELICEVELSIRGLIIIAD